MSADNGYIIRKNSAGKFVLQMYFDSNDEYPEIDRPNAELFDTMTEVLDAYCEGENTKYWSEYGLSIQCQHPTLTRKEENPMSIETQKFVRKPFEVEAIQVTAENIALVAAWCEGQLVNLSGAGATSKTYIEVKVHRPQTPRQTKAFIGDWVLFAGAGFKVYLPKAFDKSFDATGVTVIHPEVELKEETVELIGVSGGLSEPVAQALVGPEMVVVNSTEVKKSAAPSPAFLAALANSKNAQRS